MELTRETIQRENIEDLSADCLKALELARDAMNKADKKGEVENIAEADTTQETDSSAETK